MKIERRNIYCSTHTILFFFGLLLFSCNTESNTSKKQIPIEIKKRDFKNDLSITDKY